jgi:membrane protease YdiL (CAAX protease family)
MKKYIFLFFVFAFLVLIIEAILLLIAGLEEKARDYYIAHIAIAISSIIMGFLFVKDNKRAPTQNENMTYLIVIISVFVIISIVTTVSSINSLIDSGELIPTRDFVEESIGFIYTLIVNALAIYPPFYFACKLLARRYR